MAITQKEIEMKINATEEVMEMLGYDRKEITMPWGTEIILYTKKLKHSVWLQWRYKGLYKTKSRKAYETKKGYYFNECGTRIYVQV